MGFLKKKMAWRETLGPYDQTMKSLVAASPQEMAEFILHQTESQMGFRFQEEIKTVNLLNTQFEGYEVDADGLLQITTTDEEEFLLHIEFQSSRDNNMSDRQLEYSFRARKKYGEKPVISCVIYLRPDGKLQEPPLCWKFRGHKFMAFDYICIKLWELTREELLALNQPALLPLTLLTKGGASRTIVDEVYQGLRQNRLQALFPVVNMLAEQVLGQNDSEWLERKYAQMKDILQDTWTYQTMQKMAREEARKETQEQIAQLQKEAEEARKEAEEVRRQTLEQAVLAMVSERFPKLVRSAQPLIKLAQNPNQLQQLLISLSATQNEADAGYRLLHFGDEDTSESTEEEAEDK
jgi:hypothetical protein